MILKHILRGVSQTPIENSIVNLVFPIIIINEKTKLLVNT